MVSQKFLGNQFALPVLAVVEVSTEAEAVLMPKVSVLCTVPEWT